MPFLDVLLTRKEDGTVSTSVYRKHTHTNQDLAFGSHYPMAHKRAVVRTLMHRGEALCSQVYVEPRKKSKKHWKRMAFVQRLRLPQTDQGERQTAQTSITISYIHKLSHSIRRVLSHLDIRVAFHPFRTLTQELVHPKDPVPELQRKGVVYNIPYDQCPWYYVGQTGRSLEQHLGEHRRALRKEDLLASTVAEHVFTLGHQINLSKTRVMDSHPHHQTQRLLESWHIEREQSPLNRGMGMLLELYTTLLK